MFKGGYPITSSIWCGQPLWSVSVCVLVCVCGWVGGRGMKTEWVSLVCVFITGVFALLLPLRVSLRETILRRLFLGCRGTLIDCERDPLSLSLLPSAVCPHGDKKERFRRTLRIMLWFWEDSGSAVRALTETDHPDHRPRLREIGRSNDKKMTR